MFVKQLIAISTAAKKIYQRVNGVWEAMSPLPAWGVYGASTMILGLPGVVGQSRGAIIAYYSNQFWHWDPVTNSWSYKTSASPGLGVQGSGCVLDATHVYAWGAGYVEKWNGTAWSNLTPARVLTGGSEHGWAQSADVLWVCGKTNHLWHLNGGAWTDRFAEMAAALSGLSLSAAYDVWTCGDNVYILVAGYGIKHYVVKYDGAAWTYLGSTWVGSVNPSGNDLSCVWGTDDSHIWVNGRRDGGSHTFVAFWNGSVWTTQLSGDTTTGGSGGGKTIFGSSATVLATVAAAAAAPNINETTDGATWVKPTWPDVNHPNGLGAQDIAPPPEPVTVSPDVVDMRGGAPLTVSGAFTIGQAYRVFMGPLGTADDTPCHSAVPGTGFDCYSANGTTLLVVAPPVLSGSVADQHVTVQNVGTAEVSSCAITITESSWHSVVFSMRRCFPPWCDVGARRNDLENRLALIEGD